MATMTPTTQLEAVNVILTNMGEAPVATLEDELPLDATKAQMTLREICEEVQISGWFWNTETTTLSPDSSGHIYLPANILAIKTSVRSRPGMYLAIRGNRLYRVQAGNNGFNWSDPIQVEITYFLEFDEMPPVARRYAAVRAARVYQARELGDELLLREDTMDEQNAMALLRAEENENARRSLRESVSVMRVLDRDFGYRLI